MRIMMQGKSGYLACFYLKSAVENKRFKRVQLHQRNTVDGKLVFHLVAGTCTKKCKQANNH